MSRRVWVAIGLLCAVAVYGIAGFMFIEGESFFDALWTTAATMTTVGYILKTPTTTGGKIHALILIAGGVATSAYAFGVIVGAIVEGQITDVVGRKKRMRKLQNLSNHIIVCGAGRVGQQVAHFLAEEKEPFVIIDRNEEVIKKMQNCGFLALHGDATRDEVLLAAGIERARGLVSALPGDADNVYVTLTGRNLNPEIKIVARCDRPETQKKLIQAGADKVILPSVIGGRRMATAIIRPATVEFVETLIHRRDYELELEEIKVSPRSVLVGKTLKESEIKQKTGTMIVGIKRGDNFYSNLTADDRIEAEDLLIVIGSQEQLKLLEEMASG